MISEWSAFLSWIMFAVLCAKQHVCSLLVHKIIKFQQLWRFLYRSQLKHEQAHSKVESSWKFSEASIYLIGPINMENVFNHLGSFTWQNLLALSQ